MRKRMILILLAAIMSTGCGAAAEKCAEIRKDTSAAKNGLKAAHGSTATVLAFGQQEPDCFYGAEYEVICVDCGEVLNVIYREALGHVRDEGRVTCLPDCTGGGSIRYSCTRCGAEWSEAYGQEQPHTWVEGTGRETDWENGGSREITYLYCVVCGKRQEQSQSSRKGETNEEMQGSGDVDSIFDQPVRTATAGGGRRLADSLQQ